MDTPKISEPLSETLYICPRTGQPLFRHGDELRTQDSRISYIIRNEVPQFFEADPVGEGEPNDLKRLNELAPRLGWSQALAEVFGADSDHYRYATTAKRTAFLDLLPITPQSRVLEIGASLGQIVSTIARRAGEVDALEIEPEQAQFAAERCRQEGLSNVSTACGGHECHIPYLEGSFDFVVLNLVFEWCANRKLDDIFERDNYAEAQRRMLAECLRVLKPGGQFYLHTKNRYALRLLIGGRDEHGAGMRFGNALPRRIFRRLLKAKGQASYRGILYSYSKLRRMLVEAGFIDLESYWATPDFRQADAYTPTDSKSIREARRRPGFVQGDSRKTRLLMSLVPAPLVKHVAASLLFIATKPK